MAIPMISHPANKKRTNPTSSGSSVLESIRDIGSGVGQSVKQDVVGRVASDAFTSLFGGTPSSVEFPLAEKQEQPKHESRPPQMIQGAEFTSTHARSQDAQEVRQKLESVRLELKALAASMKALNVDIQKAVSDIPVNPGVYHVNFLERLRSILIVLRHQIEDSRSWLATWSSRKKKRQYWSMYKKHGTTFGLSSERVLSTQAG